MIKPIELTITYKNKVKYYELFYKKGIIFSSCSVSETTEFVQKKIKEGYYIRYTPPVIPGLLV